MKLVKPVPKVRRVPAVVLAEAAADAIEETVNDNTK
jgi:hypothetical protein